MTEDAIKLRREYNHKYREANKDVINQKHKEWRAKNKDKIREYNATYWTRQANKLKEQTKI